MTARPALYGVDQKLRRALAQINNVYGQVGAFAEQKPFVVRVDKEPRGHGFVGRCLAMKNPEVGEPDVSMVLLAGEILYQLRSALDQLVYQLVTLNGHASKLEKSRRHQFPIFDAPEAFEARSDGMIDGASEAARSLIAQEQPFVQQPDSPHSDLLWILQDLNNTDKHRLVPVTVVGIDVMRASGSDRTLFSVQSPAG